MKFTALFSVAILAGSAVAQGSFDVDDLFGREDREELVLRALHYVRQQASDHAEFLARTTEEVENALYARWGSGKYVIDDNTYHRDVKPKILSQFMQLSGFKGMCGSNPDFMVERDGTVYPSSRTDKKGLCTKKKFSLDMHDLLSSYTAPSRSPSPSPGPSTHKRELEDDVLYPRWGSGKYVIDDAVYHRDVKPKILQQFMGLGSFKSMCGSNPDFMVERDGTVYPSSRTDKKGVCTKKKFSLDMHDLLSSFLVPSRSPSPSGHRRELEERELDDLLDSLD